jgi:dCTP deaminase
MSFWTTQQIRKALGSKAPPILNAKAEHVNNACYEMALGPEIFITSIADTKQVFAAAGTQVRIPPGQFGLLLTDEELRIPLNMLAFISIKASKKMTGLVNVSGFHVDPGFSGRLKFSVYNAGSESIILEIGERLFPIWFYELSEDNEDDYKGKHKGQRTITSEDVARLQGEVASPAALKKDLDELRATVSNWKAATAGALITAIATAIAAVAAAIMKLGH